MIEKQIAKEINLLVDIVQKYHSELSLTEMVQFVVNLMKIDK